MFREGEANLANGGVSPLSIYTAISKLIVGSEIYLPTHRLTCLLGGERGCTEVGLEEA